MSLYGAMITGISGLDANAQAMSIYSSNIANVNTVGYKDVSAAFSTVLTSMFGGAENAGVTAMGEQNVTQQGLLQSASSPTDLGIEGNGFFVVSQTPSASGANFYTRAGNFTPDANGNLVNGSGYYLMGWPMSSTGAAPTSGTALEPINISDLSGKAEATQNVTLQANLEASATEVTPGTGAGEYSVGDMSTNPPTVTPDFSQTVNVYDSQGGAEPVTINYVKTGANQWNYEVSYGGNQSNITSGNTPPDMIASGTVTFNSDGSLANVTNTNGNPSGTMSFNIPFNAASGLQSQPITVNLGSIGSTGGVTQFDSPSTVVNSSVDGAVFGNLTGVSVNNNGIVSAQFSNGLTQNIYQLPLATFTNPDGLSAVSGDAYQVSANSGTATINATNTGGAGQIQSSTLEGSTVDLATEFTNLITTQRAYSAASRIVTTADEMLQQLEQLPTT